jgi:ribosome-associated protein
VSQNLKEKSLLPESNETLASDVRSGQSQLDERILLALHAAAEKKALDPVVLDLRAVASFTDFFVITSGANKRQVQAISDGVVEQLKNSGTRAARVEGYQTAEWILVDYGDFIVHVFDEKARRFYDLERLWREAARVEVPSDQIDAVGSLREK